MFKRNKINNNGSTMVMAIIAIAFVAMLATMILAASFANIAMKRMENRSKDTFYTAETVLDEVRVGLGYKSVDSLKTSYEYVMSHLVDRTGGFSYIINNDDANKKLRNMFIEDMLKKVTGNKMSFGLGDDYKLVENSTSPVIEAVCAYLNDNIDGYYESNGEMVRSATVRQIGKVIAIRQSDIFGNTIILKDVVIDYREDKAEENYFSTITVDLDITFPDLEVDFTGGNRLSSFLEYSLVADGLIKEETRTDLRINAAHIYAGKGVNITNGAYMTVTGNVVSSLGDISNANIVTRENIVVRGQATGEINARPSRLTVNGGDIWCKNFTVDSNLNSTTSDKTVGAEVKVDALSKVYVSDDLNLYGKNSKVTIGGEYYGYSSEGAKTTPTGHASSSAVIINGSNSTLDFNVNKLVIGGRSYIILDESNSYMTGESLSIKANQDIYLIPPKYIYTNEEIGVVTNPMALSTWNMIKTASGNNPVRITEPGGGVPFVFSYLYLDSSADPSLVGPKYITKVIDGNVYVYYNFRDKSCAAKYVKDILDGKDMELKAKLSSYFSSMFSGNAIKVSDTSSKYTSGIMFEYSGGLSNSGTLQGGTLSGSTTSASGSVITLDAFALTSLDCKSRYEILTRLLVDMPETKNGKQYIVDNEIRALTEFYDGFNSEDKDDFEDTSYYGKTVANNIVDFMQKKYKYIAKKCRIRKTDTAKY
jgi:hypothetical protein